MKNNRESKEEQLSLHLPFSEGEDTGFVPDLDASISNMLNLSGVNCQRMTHKHVHFGSSTNDDLDSDSSCSKK